MSREYVSTEFDCWQISVIVHRSASEKLAVVHLASHADVLRGSSRVFGP